MRASLLNDIALLFFLSAIFVFGQKPTESCISCHIDNDDKAAFLYKKDIHFSKGILCSDCHGGNGKADDLDEAMDYDNGFLGIPMGNDISLVCTKCHSDREKMKSYGSIIPTNQYEKLKKSVHFQKDISGKKSILQCVTCHSVHDIKSVSDKRSPVYSTNLPTTCASCHSDTKYMKQYNPTLQVDQYEKYLTSQHGIGNKKKDPKPADCADCHGNHEIRKANDILSKVYPSNIPKTCSECHSDADYMEQYGIPTDQYEKYEKSSHGIALLKEGDRGAPSCNSCHGNHGAIPPEVESISKICGTCHSANAELFYESKHKIAFDRLNYPECETCHGNHYVIEATDELLSLESHEGCGKCHSQTINNEGYYFAIYAKESLESLISGNKQAEKLITEAEIKGMEISDAKFALREVKEAIHLTRTAIHSLKKEKLEEILFEKGIKKTEFIIKEAKGSIDEFYFRRYGLLVFIIIISITAYLLHLYIKEIEK